MDLTSEQYDIVKAASSRDHLRVKAFAGTGKTTTLRAAAEALGSQRLLYLAFNRAIADEAKRKFPRHVKASTAHSVAFGQTKELFGDERVTNGLMEVVQGVEENPALEFVSELCEGDRRRAALVVTQTLNRWATSANESPAEEHVPTQYSARFSEDRRREAIGAATQAASQIWDDMVRPDSSMPVTHDYYLKYWALGRPRLPYSAVLFDEAQDANPVLLRVVMDQQAQQVYVGDSHQQIYRFRGAVDAMTKAQGQELPLTRSWRFGPEIAACANEVLTMLGEQLALVGGGESGLVRDEVSRGGYDAVLCRSNAGVIREVLSGLDDGKRVAVAGGAKEAANLLAAAYKLRCGQKTGHNELRMFVSWEEFEAFAQTEEGSSYSPIIRTVEEHGSNVPKLCKRLKEDTEKDEGRAEQVVSTAHKAKGREWPRVRFCDDFGSLVRQDEQGRVSVNRDEANLLYVAITRATSELNLNGYGATLKQNAQQFRESRSEASASSTGASSEPNASGQAANKRSSLRERVADVFKSAEKRRRSNGDKLFEQGAVSLISDGKFRIEGSSGKEVTVKLTCPCEDAAEGHVCEHQFAVLRAMSSSADSEPN